MPVNQQAPVMLLGIDTGSSDQLATVLSFLDLDVKRVDEDDDLPALLEQRPAPHLIMLGDCGDVRRMSTLLRTVKAAVDGQICIPE